VLLLLLSKVTDNGGGDFKCASQAQHEATYMREVGDVSCIGVAAVAAVAATAAGALWQLQGLCCKFKQASCGLGCTHRMWYEDSYMRRALFGA
jgi:hypothetical protein